MKNATITKAVLLVCVCAAAVLGQTKDAYDAESGSAPQATGLLDPSRFSMHHAMSFGASSSNGGSLKSQSLYSTMITYKFAQPVTLNLNFSLPIFSTYNSANNLTVDNLKSTEYFKSMPFDVAMTWQPRENLLFQFSVVRRTASDYYTSQYSPFRDRMYDPIFGHR